MNQNKNNLSEVIKPSFTENKDALKLITALLSKYSVIPDLFELIGNPVITFRLLQGLAGLTISFPSLESIKSLIIATDIVIRLEINKDVDRDKILTSLSKDYGLIKTDIELIYEKVRDKIVNANNEDVEQLTALIFESITKNRKLNLVESMFERRLQCKRRKAARKNDPL